MLKFEHSTVEDIPVINEWVKADPDHIAKCDGSFFVNVPRADGSIPKGIVCLKAQDENGTVFFLKFTNALIVDAQFPPTTTDEEREKLRKDLGEAFVNLTLSFKNLGYHAMFYESISTSLIRFFGRFGFRRAVDYFKVGL